MRENGGQYTHAAIWAAMAFAALGDSAVRGNCSTMINPVNHARSREAIADLQSGTLRGRRRRVCAPSSHWPRGVDLVHGFGWVDVPADHRVTSGVEARSGQTALCAVPSCGLDDFQSCTIAIARLSITSL